MGTWSRSHEDVLFGYEAELWDRYPRHVAQAFFAVSYENALPITEGDCYNQDEEAAKAIEAFTQRWGGLSDEVFVHVLQQAQDRDRLAALFAIGHSSLLHAADLLAPFLASPDLLVRCAAAVVLELRRDERSLPVLEEYLLADAPTLEAEGPRLGGKIRRIQPEAEMWFYAYRQFIVGIVADFGPASMTAVLRKAFLKYWEQEQKASFQPNYRVIDGLLYALGRRGALASLHGIALPNLHQRLAMIYLALGVLRADERFDHLYRGNLHHEMLVNCALKQEVASVCMTHFGLSEQQAKQYVSLFGSDYNERLKFRTYMVKDLPTLPDFPRSDYFADEI